MQASNTPPHHPPGVAFPTWNPAGKVERKSNRFESRMNSSASGIPGGAFLCTFVLFGCFQNLMHDAASILCSLNHYLAKYAPKRHILPIWAVLGSIRRAGRCYGRGAPFYTSLPKSNGFESRTKVETLPKSKGHPLPESRMILREKISGKVELGLNYALLFHDSGIYPVFLLIPHAVLLQSMAFHPKPDRVQGFAADKVERVQSRIGLKVG